MPVEITKPHAALLASPGMGHLIPVLELGKRMVLHHDFHVTIFVVATDISSTHSLLKSSLPTPIDHNLDIVVLPSVDISGLIDPNAPLVAKLVMHVRESMPSLKSSIAAMNYRPSALIVDLFGCVALPLADEFGMLKYVFNTSTAYFLSVIFQASSMDQEVIMEEHINGQKPLKINGCRSLKFEDTLDSFKNIDSFSGFHLVGQDMPKTNGILINTWDELENSTIKALRDDNLLRKIVKVPIYPIGPLVRNDRMEDQDERVNNWLDNQPDESVVYVSFGSGALLASPGLGHLIPVLELGKRLVSHHDFQVTIFVLATEASAAQNQLLESSQTIDALKIVSLPPVDISSKVDPAAHIVTKIIVMMRESLPGLRCTISSMTKSRPTALIVDLFGTEALPIADEFKMLKYVFIASNAWFLAITVYAPTVEKIVDEEHIKQQKPLEIPGCKPVEFEDTLEAYLNKDELYEEYCRLGLQMSRADGILVNTFESLEPTTLRSFRDGKMLGKVVKNIPVYPIGPIVRPLGGHDQGLDIDPILEWLDKQPSQSVIYVSFGSGGTLSAQQMTEIAWGLELSQQRFIWVVRPPIENDASGTFFTAGNSSDEIEMSLKLKAQGA
ncbi:UDP-glucuronosyl/UDP-glucosyltransferase [Corchorus olitorius]|uniref:UDP-glucuronosyl/UDP-glucosyltransferase n=1 Tax=Corchorus olitorius TaxID=93759 RepID=A0A1R3IP05_9ROSI|nr:UDP-glucuronosyl/UDP-glucosyltransferase [Corchorus olitorius]